MELIVVGLLAGLFVWPHVVGHEQEFISLRYENSTEPMLKQLYDFRKAHSKPIGLLTTSAGMPVLVRKTNSLNSDLLMNKFFIDSLLHLVSERIPERVVAAKGTAALGYFEVTHDVSKYTKADVFNGIGKRTPVVGRFSTTVQNRGGVDAEREPKGMAVKFYTHEGNLDLLSLNSPVFLFKDPQGFPNIIHNTRRNPRTNVVDSSARNEFITLRFESINGILRLMSDSGIPNGYRKMDVFPIHTYEIYNSKGERYYVKFNFRTLQGIENLPTEEAIRINGIDQDYFSRDLYNAIAEKKYPAWRLDMDVLTFNDLLHLDFNPFEVTREWKNGSYKTVTIGKLVFNKNPDNDYHINEQSAFNPGNLVPGISGPKDLLFRGRSLAYPATQSYRLGVNRNKIDVNRPIYEKNYNRDGSPPVLDNMKNAPNFYPNSFSGPVPYVDAAYPKQQIMVFESNAVDLQDPAYFYNHVIQTDDERDRLATNTVLFTLRGAPPFLQERLIKMFTLVDEDLGKRVTMKLKAALEAPPPPSPRVLVRLNNTLNIYKEDKTNDRVDIDLS